MSEEMPSFVRFRCIKSNLFRVIQRPKRYRGIESLCIALAQLASGRLTYEQVTGNSEWRLGQSQA
jgi:hypothetical protein